MVTLAVTYSKLRSVLAVHQLGVCSGPSLDTVKKSFKCLRHVRDAAIDFEEALKVKQTEFQKLKAEAGDDEAKIAELAITEQKFIEEVNASNKESINMEVERGQLEALKEVLGKADWTSTECKDAVKGNKITQFDMMNVDEFVEDVETILKAE